LSPGGGSLAGANDMFFACFTTDCCRLWSSYWGGAADDDFATGVTAAVINGSDRVVGSGYTYASNYPTKDFSVAATDFIQTGFVGAGAEPDGALVSFDFVRDEKLPIDLATFGATPSGRTVQVAWRTASEEDNAGFELQRAELADPSDVAEWTTISSYVSDSRLLGVGTSPVGKQYAYTDDEPGLKVGYIYAYRLVDVSHDGVRNVHPGVTVQLNASETPIYQFRLDEVRPNPSTETINLSFSLQEEEAVTVEFYSVDGKRVSTPISKQSFSAGDHSELISVKELQPGAYTAVVSTSNTSLVRTRQFVVVR
jgi:hypothetical protein